MMTDLAEVFYPPSSALPASPPTSDDNVADRDVGKDGGCIVRTDLGHGWTLIRRRPASISELPEVRCAVLGNVDAGKSTLLGVLTRGECDDGRGRARALVFRHPHEQTTGRTSSVGQEMLAFDVAGRVLRPAANYPLANQTLLWQDLCPRAAKVITFFDCAGHERYLRTTMFGLAGSSATYALLVVGANDGGALLGMTKEHLMLAWSLGLKVILVLTKIDMAPPNVRDATLQALMRLVKRLSQGRRSPLVVREPPEALTVAASNLLAHVVPVVPISSVSGQGIELLLTLLNALPLHNNAEEREAEGGNPGQRTEFAITETYSVPGVGTVVSGALLSGSVSVNQTLHLGPDTVGQFVATQVKSIHLKRISVQSVSAPHTLALALKRVKRSQIRKGAVLLSQLPTNVPLNNGLCDANFGLMGGLSGVCWEFLADIVVLFQHSTTIAAKYQAVVHCGVVRQTAQVVAIDTAEGVVRMGDRARVRFRFTRYPEYLRLHSKILFREGRTKGIGKIVQLIAPSSNASPSPNPTAVLIQ
jgi:GTPase